MPSYGELMTETPDRCSWSAGFGEDRNGEVIG